MIYLFTDFSNEGPYVGELKGVLLRAKTGYDVIDLMHDAPVFNPKASAYLLSALSKQFTDEDACLAIVDPGVGDEKRRPVIIVADGITYCGPDNGLFSQIVKQSNSVMVYEICWPPEKLSNSFHGRDLFAPALIKYLLNDELELKLVSHTNIFGTDWSETLCEVIYIDCFGNCITGINANDITKSQTINFETYSLEYARTFSEVKQGQGFWYINSMGLVELSLNQANAAEFFKIEIGLQLTIGNKAV